MMKFSDNMKKILIKSQINSDLFIERLMHLLNDDAIQSLVDGVIVDYSFVAKDLPKAIENQYPKIKNPEILSWEKDGIDRLDVKIKYNKTVYFKTQEEANEYSKTGNRGNGGYNYKYESAGYIYPGVHEDEDQVSLNLERFGTPQII